MFSFSKPPYTLTIILLVTLYLCYGISFLLDWNIKLIVQMALGIICILCGTIFSGVYYSLQKANGQSVTFSALTSVFILFIALDFGSLSLVEVLPWLSEVSLSEASLGAMMFFMITQPVFFLGTLIYGLGNKEYFPILTIAFTNPVNLTVWLLIMGMFKPGM